MSEVFDYKEEAKKAKLRLHFSLVLVFAFLAISIGVSIFLLVTSSLDYILPLVISIVLCVLSILLAIFYFLNVFPAYSYLNKTLGGINEFNITKRKVMSFDESNLDKIIKNVRHRSLRFSYEENQQNYFENFYILNNDEINFEPNKRYRLYVYQSLIIRFEVLESENN